MLDSDDVERLARMIHERYRTSWDALHREDGDEPTTSPLVGLEWAELSDEAREDNRRQARSIEQKLLDAGLELCAPDDPAAGRLRLVGQPPVGERLVWTHGAAEVVLTVEDLARVEHDRWMQRKLESGWVFGEPRNDDLKHHPLIRPWDGEGEIDGLTEAQKELDREPVRSIPGYLDAVRLGAKLRVPD